MVKDNTLVVLKDIVSRVHLDEDDVAEILIGSRHIHLFDEVKDFRKGSRITYELSDILMMAFIVILEKGKQSFYYMSSYVSFNRKRFEEMGLIKEGKIPSHDTFRRVFSLLDSKSLVDTSIMRFHRLLRQMEQEKGLRHIGVDGKAVNATGRSADSKNPSKNANVLNIYDTFSGTCLVSEVVEDKTNEIPVAQALLSQMDLSDDLITADALHCQARTTQVIRERKGHYLLCARDNQPLLLSDIRSRFLNKRNSRKITKQTSDDGSRTIEILRLPPGFEYEDFKDIRSYVKMTSHKRSSECIRYYITDLIKTDEILMGIEEHWAIENDLHKLKDDHLNEDSFRCIDRKAIKNIAIMNNLIVQLIYIYLPFSGYDLHMAKIALSCRPYEEISKLLAVLSSEKIIDQLKAMMKDPKRKRK